MPKGTASKVRAKQAMGKENFYTYLRRWQRDGTLKELRDALLSIRRVSRLRSAPQPVSDQYPVPAA